MLDKISLENIFFLDIETVPEYPDYSTVPEHIKKLWDAKAERIKTPEIEHSSDDLYQRAGIYAEFGKIICISIGIFKNESGTSKFRIKSFYDDDEKSLLKEFISLIENYFNSNTQYLCAHNGKEFDFPYISRRILINGLKLPFVFDIGGKKPWEIEYFLDTMQLWRFGDIKHYTSLELLCTIFNVPTSKDDIEGKDVWKVYWENKELLRIVNYCEKDVIAIARLIMRFKGVPILTDENILRVHGA
jgi:3'-5' exonuclease